MSAQTTSIPVSPEVFERARAQKRAGETWEDLVAQMLDQYEPPARQEGTP